MNIRQAHCKALPSGYSKAVIQNIFNLIVIHFCWELFHQN